MTQNEKQLQKSVVLLLKSTNEQQSTECEASCKQSDPYKAALQEQNLDAHSVTALNFNYINADLIQTCLRTADDYSCLILSSAKSVESVLKAVAQSEWNESIGPQWRKKRTYVVGAATEKAAQKLGLDTYGSQAGSSEALADVIIQDMHNMVIDVEDKPALFLCSSIKLDLLPTKIRAEGIRVKCVDAYDTIPSPNLNIDLLTFQQSKGYPACIVFYSPSGVRASIPLIQACGWPLADIHMIAIGPTTEEEIRLQGIKYVYTADQPKPVCVAEACMKALNQST